MNNFPQPRRIHFLLLPVLYFAAAKISQLTVMPEGIAMLWLPNSVVLAAFIRFQGRGMVYFSMLALAAEVLADLPIFSLVEALIFGIANLLEATIAYVLLKKWRFDPRFESVHDLAKFALAGPVIAAFIAACCGAWVYRLNGAATSYFDYLRIWWFGDALGLLILTPAILGTVARGGMRTLSTQLPDRLGTLALLLVAATLALLAATHGGELWGMSLGPTLLLPFVLFAAARLTLAWVALLVVIVAYAVIGMMVGGLALFGALPTAEAVIHAQEFILVMSLMATGLAALLTQIRARQEDIAALNAGLERRIQERTHDLEQALAELKQLQGLLPICISCKKIRDDAGRWEKLEKYISERSEARFSHGICPECMSVQTQSD